jgi:hypothetical protein
MNRHNFKLSQKRWQAVYARSTYDDFEGIR